MYDEALASLRREGVRDLAFGLAPFFNPQTTPFFGSLWMELACRFLFHMGEPLYQFQNLAFAKARCVLYSMGFFPKLGAACSCLLQ